MSTYFDPIMQQETILDENTIVYLVKIGDNKFCIKAISSGLELLPSDPTTHATEYWPVPIESLINQANSQLLFEKDKLTDKPLTKEQVIELFKFNPNETQPKKFSTSIKEELINNWARDVTQDELMNAARNSNLLFFRPIVLQRHAENSPTQQVDADSIPSSLLMLLVPRIVNNQQDQIALLLFNIFLVQANQTQEPEPENEERHTNNM
ncbi:hypothetical protein ACQUW5_06060 [Legionella sp. CNM-1927-20]|uniref:hypothetical protein n=1 Tax=Legionella sp. CNM-1927-20 TaxID=3422221 RepID=UPI00403AEB6B